MRRGRLVTSLFSGIREDRPLEYYLTPLIDLNSRLVDCEGAQPVLYTFESDRNSLEQALPHFLVRPADLDVLVGAIWREPRWREVYSELIAQNPTNHDSYQARFKSLIGVYLAKIALIDASFEEGVDWVLWFDAGHWVSHQCSHDLNHYSADLIKNMKPEMFVQSLEAFSRNYGIVGTRSEPGRTRFHMPLEWLYESFRQNDGRFGQGERFLYQGMFWLVDRSKRAHFLRGFRSRWRRLVGERKAGTEENALTLYCWENDVHSLRYVDWIRAMEGEKCLHMSA